MPDGRRFRIEIDPRQIEALGTRVREALGELRDRADEGWQQARHLKVRLLWKGQRVGPDLPLPALLLGEGAVLATLGPVATVLANLGARVLLEVDVVHDADTWIAEAAAARERGEVLYAEERLRAALESRQDDPASLVPLGELLIATGREAEGLTCLHRAAMGPSGHPDVLLAAELLARHPT